MAARDVETLHTQVMKSSLLSLTTVATDGQPRSVVVWFAADVALSLVFMSRSTRRHCQELRADGRVSGTILKRDELTDKGPGSKVRGVMFRGAAIETAGDAQEAAYAVYQAKWPQVADLAPLAEVLRGSSPMRFYSITPSEYTLFDEKYYRPIGEDPLRELGEW